MLLNTVEVKIYSGKSNLNSLRGSPSPQKSHQVRNCLWYKTLKFENSQIYWANFKFEYLGKFETEIENMSGDGSGAQSGFIDKKNRGKNLVTLSMHKELSCEYR
jgi:hypothetical protein